MSVSLAVKLGSREGLKVRSRCGCNLCARQMRSTEPSEMPMALAVARPVQWVAWCDGSVQSLPPRRRGSAPPLARWFPLRSAPCRVCGTCRAADPQPRSRQSVVGHRHTVGRLTPMLCATCCAAIRRGEYNAARSTCLRGRLRSAAIAANCPRSAALKTTHTGCATALIPQATAQYCTS